MTTGLADVLASEIEAALDSPVRRNMGICEFARRVLGVRMWSGQRRMCRLVERAVLGGEARRVSVGTGHGVGKTFSCSLVTCWAVACLDPPPVVITSAPTFRQVRDQLWSEARAMWNECRWTRSMAEMKTVRVDVGERHYAYGFSTDSPSRFQGIHAAQLLFVIDEANGFPEEIWQGIDSCMTGRRSTLVCVGNCVIPFGKFYKSFSEPSVLTMRISAREHPNVRSGRELVPGAVTREWVEDFEREYASMPEVVRARIDAVFPDSAEWTLVSRSLLGEARAVEARTTSPSAYGLDVARYGSAKTVLTLQRGQLMARQRSWHGMSTVQTTELVEQEYRADPANVIVVDDVAVGGGVTDLLLARGLPAVPFTGGEAARRRDKYVNRVSEAWCDVRDAMHLRLLSLGAAGSVLEQQLCTRNYEVRMDRRVRIEPKDKYTRRTSLSSPDHADSFVMAASWVLDAWRAAA